MSQSPDKTVSSPTPPATWFLLLAAAVVAVWYNYTLLAGLTAKFVGGSAIIFGANVGSVAAGVIVALEVFNGLFFLESRGITHMFPVIHALPATARQWLGYGFVCLFVCYASMQAGLVWMARVLTERATAEPYVPLNQGLPAVEMAVAFVLPFVLILAGLSVDRVARILGERRA